MAEQRRKKDNRIAIIVILAGLLTGGVLTYVYLQPEDQPRYSPEYPVAQSHRIPFGSAEAAPTETDEAGAVVAEGDEADEPGTEADGAREATSDQSTAPAQGADAEQDDGSVLDSDELDPAERATIRGAQRREEPEGVEDYVELTEERYIRLSARMVIDAHALSKAVGEDADPVEVQHLLAERAAERLAEAEVDPEDFWAYTRDIHSDPDRAKEMGEKILREAEKHTQYKITVEDVPGMTPTPVPGADE
ncbi:MAG: hypothetical protein GF393_07630 [Armatimonadia bacterium]|nr:hypothetical protein [Armatimonadia bacterium]